VPLNEFMWFVVGPASLIPLLLGFCGLLYALIYGGTLRKKKEQKERYNIDESAVRQFESERAIGRSKFFGHPKRNGYIITENWLYHEPGGVLFPLREVVSTHRSVDEFPNRAPVLYLKLTFRNGGEIRATFISRAKDIVPMQDALRQLLPNAQHTSEI